MTARCHGHVVADVRKVIAWLAKQSGVNGKVGIMGFCWGGGVVGRVATAEPALGAGRDITDRRRPPMRFRISRRHCCCIMWDWMIVSTQASRVLRMRWKKRE